MPYSYEVSFNIRSDQMSQVEIGQSLDRLVGYLKIRLPVQQGFVFANAWYSVDDPEKMRIVARSEWGDWLDVERHRKSEILEDHLFEEFEPHISKDDITVRTYAEVGSGPLSVRR